MIKIDVLIKAAEYLENSENSLIKLNHDFDNTSPINKIKKEPKDKYVARCEKAIHNTLEKNRRAHLKECFEQLQKELPLLKEKKKATNLSILNYTLKFIQTSQKKNKENEFELNKLMKKQEQLNNTLRKALFDIESEHPEYKSLVYEQIKNYANLQESIENARIDAEKVKNPIKESSNDESGYDIENMQHAENQIDRGRSFCSYKDDYLIKTVVVNGALVDQIKNFGNIRIDMDTPASFNQASVLTNVGANYANKMQMLRLTSQTVENN